MKLTEGQIISAINEYIDKELMPLSSGMSMTEQFLHGFKMGIAKRKIPAVVQGKLANPMLKDAEGKIDADILFDSAAESMNRVHQVEIAGFKFNAQDLAKLREIAKRYEGG